MNIRHYFMLLACTTSMVVVSCESDETELKTTQLDLPATPYQYTTGTTLPTLGRVLFYDTRLSLNNTVSCASCHKQSSAFADNKAFSLGFESKQTLRNSMPIQNIASNFSSLLLFWDGREDNIQEMVLQPIANHIEMGMDNFDDLTNKLKLSPYYPVLFNEAFGNTQITQDKIAAALSAFVMSINSNNTKFDKFSQQGNAALNATELQGLKLFLEKYDCNSCHQVQDPHGYIQAGTFANIGLDQDYEDEGLQLITQNPQDAGKFRIPSLRNIALTAPYMHDGRFETLEEVIDHYSEGMADHPNLDPRLRFASNNTLKMNISEEEKFALIAFLKTLTDPEMVSNPAFSNPFKVKQ